MSKLIRVEFTLGNQRRMENRSASMGREIAAIQLEIDRALDKVDCLLSALERSEDGL